MRLEYFRCQNCLFPCSWTDHERIRANYPGEKVVR